MSNQEKRIQETETKDVRGCRPGKLWFVLDSAHLEEVRTVFYGYTFMGDRVVDRLPLPDGRGPNPDGSWVYVKREADTVTVTQDFIGSFGLYLYRQDDYFALSNSFLLLVETLSRSGKTITLNRDYANCLLCATMCASTLEETLANEIILLDRSAVVQIDIPSKTLRTRLTDYQENTVDPATPEGLELLDAWWEKWRNRLRGFALSGGNLRIDLSGGFDSRMTLGILLSSGIRMEDVQVFSKTDGLHSHSEDYEIASAIAARYGFVLNDSHNVSKESTPLSLEEILDTSLSLKLGFHKQMYYKYAFHNQRWYSVNGNGGAYIRNVSGQTEDEYIRKSTRDYDVFSLVPEEQQAEIQASVRKLFGRSFDRLRARYEAFGRSLDPSEISWALYRETRGRNHVGKAMAEQYQVNNISLAPLLDPDLHRLKISSGVCGDSLFLVALIYKRFAPGLLEFRFNQDKGFRPETLRIIDQVNESSPWHPAPLPEIRVKPCEEPSGPSGGKPAQIAKGTPETVVFRAFQSPEFQQVLDGALDHSLYLSIVRDALVRKYHSLSMVNAAMAIGSVLWAQSRQSGSFLAFVLRHAEAPDSGPSDVYQSAKALLPDDYNPDRPSSTGIKQIIRKHTPQPLISLWHRLAKGRP